jgi:hypothetical protein
MKLTRRRTMVAPLAIPLILAGLVVAQQFLEVPGDGRLVRGLENALHGPWFALVTWLLQLTLVRVAKREANAATLLVGFTLALVLALASEAVQLSQGRNASLGDVLLDMVGATAGLALWAAAAGMVRWRAAMSLAILMLTLSSAPLLGALAVRSYQSYLAPTLVRFDQAPAAWLYHSNSAAVVVDGLLVVRLADTRWPGITLPEPIADWRGYQRLVVELELDEALDLSVSVRLAGRDHVYRNTALLPGPQVLSLDLPTMFDVEQERVTAVVIYSHPVFSGRTLRIRRVRLE